MTTMQRSPQVQFGGWLDDWKANRAAKKAASSAVSPEAVQAEQEIQRLRLEAQRNAAKTKTEAAARAKYATYMEAADNAVNEGLAYLQQKLEESKQLEAQADAALEAGNLKKSKLDEQFDGQLDALQAATEQLLESIRAQQSRSQEVRQNFQRSSERAAEVLKQLTGTKVDTDA